MTILQCVRCIDPLGANLIYPYDFLRFTSLTVTLTIYFEYSATAYVVMDTLYACALKRTPSWLKVILGVMPFTDVLVSFGCAIAQYTTHQQWVAAVVGFHAALIFSVNMTTYDICGLKLIRILKEHQNGTTGEDISGSQSAKPFEVVISKTYRAMILLTIPSLATIIFFFYTAVTAANTMPLPTYDPANPQPANLVTISVHLLLGLFFTRSCWISKTTLDAEILAKTSSPPSSHISHGTPSSERTTRAMSRADLKDRAMRMSQSPKPRASEELSPPTSRPDVEMPEVIPAKAGVEVSASKSDVDNSLLVFNEADIV